MQILLDEDVAIQVLEPLRHLLEGHPVRHVSKIRWKGKKDRFLFKDAAARGYELLLTKDRGQLDDPEELGLIKRSGLHHVRFSQRGRGMPGLGRAMASILAGMPMLVPALGAVDSQRLVRLKGVSGNPSDRYDIVNPLEDPPPYWPR